MASGSQGRAAGDADVRAVDAARRALAAAEGRGAPPAEVQALRERLGACVERLNRLRRGLA